MAGPRLNSVPGLVPGMALGLALMLAGGVSPAEGHASPMIRAAHGHCFRIWRYPYAQRCAKFSPRGRGAVGGRPRLEASASAKAPGPAGVPDLPLPDADPAITALRDALTWTSPPRW